MPEEPKGITHTYTIPMIVVRSIVKAYIENRYKVSHGSMTYDADGIIYDVEFFEKAFSGDSFKYHVSEDSKAAEFNTAMADVRKLDPDM